MEASGGKLLHRDLTVSRQHRVLVRSEVAEQTLGTREALIPAVKLTDKDGIEIVENCRQVTYWHLLFDQIEIINGERSLTEGLFTGPEALTALGLAARAEIQSLFPEITGPDYIAQHVRPVPAKGKDIRYFLEQINRDQQLRVET